MKIIIINYRYFVSGGPERYLFNVIDLLQQHGHQVIPFSIKSKKNVPTNYEKYFADPLGGQDIHYYDQGKKNIRYMVDVIARLFYSFHVRKRLTRLLIEEKPDAAYILHHYNKLSPSVISACKKNKVPVVLRLSDFFLLCPQAHFLRNGEVCEECLDSSMLACVKNKCVKSSRIGSLLKAFALYFHKRILKIYDDVDIFICTTNFMKQKMIKGDVSPDKIVVIKTFVDSSTNDLNRVGEAGYILYFGRFSHEKGVDILLEAYYKSKLYEKNIRLVLVGGEKSDLAEKYRQLIDSLGDFVEVHGFLPVNELGPLIQKCNFTVIPSRWYENLPNTILESYKYCKPVITTRLGSLPEVVQDSETGYLFENGNADDLAKKMQLLVNDDEKRDYMRKQIKARINDYSRNQHYNSLINVLSSVK